MHLCSCVVVNSNFYKEVLAPSYKPVLEILTVRLCYLFVVRKIRQKLPASDSYFRIKLLCCVVDTCTLLHSSLVLLSTPVCVCV